MIELSDFTKCYGDLVAVDRLNLAIHRGEIFGFIGPNGAGKTTTIRFLATLLKPTRGDGTVNGYSVTRHPLDVRRSIGYMPDSFGVYEGMKVGQFLEFFAAAYRIPRGRRRQVIGGVLERLSLSLKRNASLGGLSRGMKQRLCLAKTLLHDPPVLILDEPASGLDPRARVEMKSLLRELRESGKTILISSHILSELADCCTTIGIIERGNLLVHGPIEEVYRCIGRKRVLEIRLLDPIQAGLEVLGSDPKLTIAQADGGAVTVELEANDREVAELLARLVTQGVRVLSFAEKELSLEEVFLRVTKGVVG